MTGRANPGASDAYEKQLWATRKWLIAAFVVNLPLVAALYAEAVTRDHRVMLDALLHEGMFLSMLVAYGVMLGAGRPRPALTLALVLYWCADEVAFLSVLGGWAGEQLLGAPCMFSMPVKLGGLLSLWATFRAQGKRLRELGLRDGWHQRLPALMLALLALVTVAHGAHVGEVAGRQRRMERASRECRYNLRSWFTAEKAYFQEHDAYEADQSKVGFIPERGNRYAYFFSRSGPFQSRATSEGPARGPLRGFLVDTFKRGESRAVRLEQLPAQLAGGVDLGVVGTCPDCQATAACAAQLDDDPTLDVWSISTGERSVGGRTIREGGLFHEVDDLAQ